MRKSAVVKLQVVNLVNILMLMLWWGRYLVVPEAKIGMFSLTLLRLVYLTCGYLALWLVPWLANRLDPKPFIVQHMISRLIASWLGYMLLVLIVPSWFQARNLGLPVGILFSVVGVLSMDVPRNRIIGIRISWTLSSNRIWHLVNRLAGWLMLGTSFVLIGAGAVWPKQFPAFLIVAALVIVTIPTLDAYWLAQNNH